MKPSPHFLVGVALLLGMTVLLRHVSHGEAIPLKRGFAEFPLQIGDRWRGQELGIGKAILDVLKVDDYMMRLYQGPREEPVWLYVGFYKTQRTGGSYHSPLNCLPGAGWTIQSREIVPVPVADRTLHVNQVFIQKGLDRQLILYWYQDRSRIIASEYWAKVYLVWDAMTKNRTDGALVRISVPVASTTEEASQQGLTFLREVWPLLLDFMPADKQAS
jgi:EpsI family protein